MTLSADLHALADRLARLAPSHRDPFRFHEEKSEIVHELRRLASSERIPFIIAANDNIRGFAPGNYACRCRNCGERFTGAKHSWRCQQCEPHPLLLRKSSGISRQLRCGKFCHD